MKAILYILLIVIIIGGVCVVTCPDREAHSAALKSLATKVISEELSGEEEDADLVMLGSVLGTGLGGFVIDNMLNVYNIFPTINAFFFPILSTSLVTGICHNVLDNV